MKTFLLPSYLNESIAYKFLSESGNTFYLGTKTMPFNNWIDQYTTQKNTPDLTLCLFYKKLINLKNKFPLYGNMFEYIEFSSSIVSFTKECLLYKIDFNSLPQNSKSEEELKKILLLCAEENFIEKELANINPTKINLTNVTSFENSFTNTFMATLHKKLIDCGLSYATLNDGQPIESSYRFALNPRQEIESIAQEIITNNFHASEINLVCCESANFDLIQQIFNRYEIPLGFTNRNKPSSVARSFSALIECFIFKDVDHLINAFELHCFDSHLTSSCLKYIHQFIFKLDECLVPNHRIKDSDYSLLLGKKENEFLLNAENEFNQFVAKYSNVIETILSFTDVQEVLTYSFGLCANVYRANNHYDELYQLKNSIEEIQPTLENYVDLKIVVELCKYKTISHSTSIHNVVAVTNLSHPVLTRKYTYVVGASQKLYPNFKSCEGLFDETYVSHISYPSLEERFNIHMEQLTWIEKSASEKLLYSFSFLDYQGKKSESSFEIESRYGMPLPLTLRLSNQTKYFTHHLDEQLAQSLFLDDHILHGSVSSFERYFNCPFSYFVKYGLRIDKQSNTEIAANTIGTIQHALLEFATSNFGKKYAEIDKETINEIITLYFNVLGLLFPKETNKLTIIKARMISNMETSLVFLKDMEIQTSFTPTHFEYRFKTDFLKNISIHGVIDRIDFCYDFLRIIDYKSSTKSLSENKVKAGLQLQLLTYLLITKDAFDKKAIGAYYVSLNTTTSTIPSGKVSKGEYIETTAEDCLNDFMKNERLTGWTFESSDTLDMNAQHIVGAKVNKDGLISFSEMDLSKVEVAIHELYHLLYGYLCDGNIQVDPVKDACTYCNYKSICRFKGEPKKEKPLVMADMKFKKGNDVDEVE